VSGNNNCISKMDATVHPDLKLEVHGRLTGHLPVELIQIIVQYFDNQIGTVSTFAAAIYPHGLAIDMKDNIYVAMAHCVGKISPTGTMTTVTDNEELQYRFVALDHNETCLFVMSSNGALRRITL